MQGKVGHLCGCLCGKLLVAVLLEFLFWQRYFVRSIALTGLKQRRAIAEAGACCENGSALARAGRRSLGGTQER